MIYLLDTSALVRLLRDPKLQEGWYDAIDAEAIGSCYPQRAEFLYSARHAAEYDEIAEMFSDLYPDVAVPKTAGRWISSVQYQMARAGQHRSASAVDLIIAATAAHHGLTVLHDDFDYRTVARHSSDLAEQNVHDLALACCLTCAGINRHEGGDGRAPRRRASEPTAAPSHALRLARGVVKR